MNKKLFCATTGRSGTKFIAAVFDHLTDIPSFHENIPYCIGQTSKEINNDEVSPQTQRVLNEKMARINRIVSVHGAYFEANNMFAKSFGWRVLDEFDDVYCIYVERNPMDFFFSAGARCWRMDYDWYLQPHWKRNYLRTGGPPVKFYEAILFTWYEVRERYYRWKQAGRFKKSWEFDFNNLNDLSQYYEMFEHFGIEYRRVNHLPELPRNEGNKPTARFQELRTEFLRKWNRSGVEWAFRSDVELMGENQ